MFIYFLFYIFIAFASLYFFKFNNFTFLNNKPFNIYFKINYHFIFILIFLFIGFRFDVGGDWYHYINFLYLVKNKSLYDSLLITDPAYALLNWITSYFDLNIIFLNLLCSLFFTVGLYIFCSSLPQPWLSLCVAFPYLIIVVAMGYTRQAVAIGMIMISINALEKSNFKFFIIFVLIASLFHKTALFILPIAFFAGKKSWSFFIGMLVISFLLYFLI